MLTDSSIVPECIYGPGSFGGLMALYEGNFIKLNHLLGGISKSAGDRYLSAGTADCDLYLTVESSVKYTQVFRMTYLFLDEDFPEENRLIADPDLCVRVFLDARLVEVAGWAAHHQHDVLKGLHQRFTRELDRRWANNMMLGKWLDYLLDMGHSFQPVSDLVKAGDRCAVTSALSR
jgi:uncharacterized protein YqiB (DUF1249 family)